jgi:rRNA maturation endonuclease Nob1
MSISEATQKALAVQKSRSVKKTRSELEMALSRLMKGNPRVVKQGTKVNAASVAREARIDRATLYRYHEPILVEIRKINDSTPKARLKESRSELSQADAKLKEYRKLVEEAQEEVVALARENYKLDGRIAELEELLRVRDSIIEGLQRQLNAKASPVSFHKT